MKLRSTILVAILALPVDAASRSHPPIRPLPTPSDRAMTQAQRSLYVEPVKGLDTNSGSREQPWKTLAHSAKQLKPGDVLYLRGGTYFERTRLTIAGTREAPITIRSFPGELAILDGGLREFVESPATAWEPCPDGVAGEYRSTKTYVDPEARADSTNVLGHLADSMVPLQGYKFLADLRSDNIYWNVKNKVGQEGNIYCGPGLYHDPASGRIHVRLAHTKMPYLPDADNYTGETDPRKLPLVVAGNKADSTLTLEGCRFVAVQDLVLRGSRAATVTVLGCEGIDFDGLTVYSGQSCFRIQETGALRLWNTACRGISAPWTFRGSLKYRAIEARIVSASGWKPTPIPNRDFEFGYCEFTDSVDGVFIGGVRNVRIHHNLFDNITDDGIFLTSGTGFDGVTLGGNVEITQNRFTHCLTCFAFGVGHGRQRGLASGLQTGSGVNAARNVFDLRDVIRYHQPSSPGEAQEISSHGRVAGDHGSPAWEPINFYHNTVLFNTDRTRSYPMADGTGHGTRRRVFNNIVVEAEKLPGAAFPPATADFIADSNLLWSAAKGTEAGDPFAKFRGSKPFTDSKAKYAPGWTSNDLFTDPKFTAYSADGKQPADVTLKPESPAIDAGLPIPNEWPDPLRASDKGKPDLGAIPSDLEPWNVGVRGRLSVFGSDKVLAAKVEPGPLPAATRFEVPAWKGKPAAMVVGYPAPVSELIGYAIRRQGVPVAEFDKTWLDTKEYDKYSAVLIVGSLTRAKATPDKFSADDLKRLDAYLKAGGTLVAVLQGKLAFQTPEAQVYLQGLTGISPIKKGAVPKFEILQPTHPWVKHLDAKATQPWQKAKYSGELILRTGSQGERIVGSADGQTLLYRVPVGKGQLIYLGWDVHEALPYTRDKNPTVEGEKSFDAQMKMLFRIAADVFPMK